MNVISPVDATVVVVYLLLTACLGLWLSRGQKNLQGYFVGNRDIAWWLILASIVATETSTVTFLSLPGFGFANNLTFLQLALGFVVGRCVIAWFLLPQFFRGELLSAYQLLQVRFGRTVQRVAGGLFLVTRTLADGLRLYLTALLLREFTGWPLPVSVLLMGFGTMIYTFLGGIRAVIWTDLMQLIVYMVGALLAFIILVGLLPDGWTGFVSGGVEGDKFRLFDWEFSLTNPYSFWTGLIGGALFTMASHGADQMTVQRYLCARSVWQARWALMLSGLVVFSQFLLFLMIGIGLYLLNSSGGFPLPDGVRNDQVFGMFIVGYLPTGLVGLVVAAVLAAAMSTLSSSLNSSANTLVNDFARPLFPDIGDGSVLWLSRLATIFFGVLQVAVALGAYRVQTDQLVVEQVLGVAGLTSGLILGLFVLGSVSRKVGQSAALVGLLVAAVVLALLYRPAPAIIANYPEWVPDFFRRTILAWPWYAPVGASVTVAVALSISVLSRLHGPAATPADGSPQSGDALSG